MAEFITTNGASAGIEKIIRSAKREIIICSPYLKISKIFTDRLLEAEKNRVSITIIYGKNELSVVEFERLNNLQKLKLYYLEELHAKCYCNEQTMIISSMNFYEFSQLNNREMGVMFDRSTDRDLFDDAKKELNSIIQVSELKERSSQNKGSDFGKVSNLGICIRCEDSIPYDVDRPFCYLCYSSWAYYENRQYEERFCHKCGCAEITSMDRPVCSACFQKNNGWL